LLTANAASAAVVPGVGPRATSNAGHSIAVVHKTFLKTTRSAAFDIYPTPVAAYTDATCLFDLDRFQDFKSGSAITDCDGLTLSSPDTAEKRSVPNSWGTWGSPPDTEGAEPDIIWTLGLSSFTINSAAPLSSFGVEAEPNPFEEHVISVSYYSGPDGSGDLVGTISRAVSGDAGAKLFAASTDTPFQSVVISSDVDFAFGQVRVDVA